MDTDWMVWVKNVKAFTNTNDSRASLRWIYVEEAEEDSENNNGAAIFHACWNSNNIPLVNMAIEF